MSEQTKIEWADSSWNPWIGCTKVSPGCLNCYAEVQTFTRAQRAQGKELWGKGQPRHRTSAAMWKQPLKWNREADGITERPLQCPRCEDRFSIFRGRPPLPEECPICAKNGHVVYLKTQSRPRVFPSMCDWLDEEVPIEWLADFLKLVSATPHLDWLLLTKRPENFNERMDEVAVLWRDDAPDGGDADAGDWLACWTKCDEPPANVWVGTSVEDQTRADERIPALLRIPAKVRFLSVEPLLGPVDISSYLPWKADHQRRGLPEPLSSAIGNLTDVEGVDWVIVGGESGPKARECNVEWVRSIVDQCKAAGAACFVKQLGSRAVGPAVSFDYRVTTGTVERSLGLKHPKGGDMAEWPEELRVREMPGNLQFPISDCQLKRDGGVAP